MQDLIQLFQSLDRHISLWINGLAVSPFFDVFFPIITDLHHTWQFKFILVPFMLFLFLIHKRIEGLAISLGLILSLGLSDFTGSVIKNFFQRRRPFAISTDFLQRSPAGGFSFPSNHAINMFCLVFFLSTFFPKYRWLYFLIAFLVAYSRVYNGVHFFSDVVFGALMGSLFGIIGSDITQRAIHRIDLLWKGNRRG